MKRPKYSDYMKNVTQFTHDEAEREYKRDLEKYCDWLEGLKSPIIKKTSYGVEAGKPGWCCPLCQFDGRVDPNCNICEGKYDLPVSSWEEYDEYVESRKGGQNR